ncbi:MAG: hypothetical protein K6347_02845 [Campylobacterales bacterium]
MNRMKLTIASVTSSRFLSHIRFLEANLSMLIIDTPQTDQRLQPGSTLTILFKETDVALARTLTPSTLGHIDVVVENIEQGEVLNEVHLSSRLGSLTALVPLFDVSVGEKLYALIHPAHILLAKDSHGE